MKREYKKHVLVRSPKITELLIKLFQKGGEVIPKNNISNLAYYSTKFENIR